MGKKSLRKRYTIGRPSLKAARVMIPWFVIEREARMKEMTAEEFVEQHDVECIFDDFPGVRYEFVPKLKKEMIEGEPHTD